MRQENIVVTNLDSGGVAQASAIESQGFSRQTDAGVDRVPVLDMKKGSTAPEDLGGVIGFDAYPLLPVNTPHPFFQAF